MTHKTIEEIQLSQNFWTCEPVMESGGYGDTSARPWLGKVSEICLNYEKTARNGNFKLSHFDPESGKADLDYNSTAYCSPKNVFDTEKEAWECYYSLILRDEEEILNEVKFVIDKLKSFL